MNRSMAAKFAKAKKEAIKEVMERNNDFAQTSWSRQGCNANKFFRMKPYGA